jgi:hypothetical protein
VKFDLQAIVGQVVARDPGAKGLEQSSGGVWAEVADDLEFVNKLKRDAQPVTRRRRRLLQASSKEQSIYRPLLAKAHKLPCAQPEPPYPYLWLHSG